MKEIVIKIPDKWFDDMVKEEFTEIDELCALIQHSTILPKWHSDLIDRNELCGEIFDKKSINALKNAIAIVKADRSEE